jgi:hypothetical protein
LITRNGLPVQVNDVDAKLVGKRGTLDLHYRIEWLRSGNEYSVGTGTWSIVRGTGVYAGLTGGGRQSATFRSSGPASFSSEGFVYRANR